MRHSSFYLRAGLLFFAIFGVAVDSSAQLDGYRVAQTQAEAAKPGSLEELQHRLLQGAFASYYNLRICDELTKENLKLAKQAGNPSAEAAARIQVAYSRFWYEGEVDLQEELQDIDELFDGEASPEICAEYYRHLYLLELSLGDRNARESIRNANRYAHECTNRLHKASLYFQIAFTRIAFDEENVMGNDIVQMLKFVEDTGRDLNVNSLLIGAATCRGGVRSLSDREALPYLERAAELAAEHPDADSTFVMHPVEDLSLIAAGRKNYEKAAAYAIDNVARLRKGESENLVNYAATAAADYLVCQDRAEEAIPYVEMVVNSRFRHFDPILLEELCRIGMEAYHATGNLEGALACAKVIMTEEHSRAVRKMTRDNSRVDRDLASLNADLTRELQAHKVRAKDLQVESQSATARADRMLAFAVIVSCVLGIAVLVCVLLIYRDRLAASRLDLASEKLKANRMTHTLEKKRLESLTLLAGGVAHDFNNLLAGILGSAELLQMPSLDEPSKDKFLGAIIASCQRASDLSRHMLTYAGYQVVDRVDCNLNALLHNSAVVLETCAQGSQLQLTTADHPLLARVDRTQVEQVLLNLVGNAAKASGENGGLITVEASQMTLDSIPSGDSSFVLLPESAGEFAVLEVRDEGNGVAPGEIRSMFEPFFTRFSAGRGLGLAVVYGIVSAHKGAIQVRHGAEKGLHIRALFPLDPAVSREHARIDLNEKPEPVVSLPGLDDVRILVVDDEPFVRNSLSLLLTRSGGNVTATENRDEALELIKQQPDYDLVLMDVVMPGIPLPDFLAISDIGCPIVLMTGNSRSNVEDLTQDPRIARVLEKPFRTQTLHRAVAQVLNDSRVDDASEFHIRRTAASA